MEIARKQREVKLAIMACLPEPIYVLSALAMLIARNEDLEKESQ
jgi:hypothetical protein